jgi:hypothetical protein
VWRLALVVLSAVACSAPSVQMPAQTLSLVFHKGDVYKYSLHTVAHEEHGFAIYGDLAPDLTLHGAFHMDVTATETVTVQSVRANGAAEASGELTDFVMDSQTYPKRPPWNFNIGADGHTLDISGLNYAGLFPYGVSIGSVNLISAVLPPGAVKPGDTWTKDYDETAPYTAGTIHIATKSSYLRDEAVQGVETAVVETTSETNFDISVDAGKLLPAGSAAAQAFNPNGPGDIKTKGKITSNVTTWVNRKAHRIVKSHMTATTATAITSPGFARDGGPGTTTVTGTATLDLLATH